MLQQILNDMYVDPDLLAELDEEQKQILFCKMREEQVRKWTIREEMERNNPNLSYKRFKNKGTKSVSFLTGSDDDPMVFMIGGEDDVCADDDALLQEKASRQADSEGEAIRKATEEELDKLVRMSQSTVREMQRTSEQRRKNIHNPRSKENATDPTRDAVVRSLQEATQKMEEEVRALQRCQESPQTQKEDSNPKNSSNGRSLPPTTLFPASSNSENVSLLSYTPNLSSLNPYTTPVSENISNSSDVSSTISGNQTFNPNLQQVVTDDLNKPKLDSFPSSVPNTSNGPHINVAPYEYNADQTQLTSLGVTAQMVDQYESLSQCCSFEALKTATLEGAKRRRSREILDALRKQASVDLSGERPTEGGQVGSEDEAWQEQERKAKETELRIREIARRAREEHRRRTSFSSPDEDLASSPFAPTSFDNSLNVDVGIQNTNHNFPTELTTIKDNVLQDTTNNGFHNDVNGNIKKISIKRENIKKIGLSNTLDDRPLRPPSRDAVIRWFQEEEIPKGVGLNSLKSDVETWFHGILSRTEAEYLLESATPGSFLVRVSERIWGYAVSYRAPDRCRHYLVDADEGKYEFLGAHENAHSSLANLIAYHTREPITVSGQEILTYPIGQQDSEEVDYSEMFSNTNYAKLVQTQS